MNGFGSGINFVMSFLVVTLSIFSNSNRLRVTGGDGSKFSKSMTMRVKNGLGIGTIIRFDPNAARILCSISNRVRISGPPNSNSFS